MISVGEVTRDEREVKAVQIMYYIFQKLFINYLDCLFDGRWYFIQGKSDICRDTLM